MSVYLVCEGDTGGLDERVLDLIVVQKLQRNVLIVPAGGDASLKSVALYLRQRYGERAYVIEDRNFRSAEEVEREWSLPSQRHWFWRRHEIENYLIDARIVADAFRSLQAAGVRNAHKLPSNEHAVSKVLQDIARSNIEAYAGWRTYWHLNTLKNNAPCDLRLAKPVPEPQDRQEWINYLSSESARLKQACHDLIGNLDFDSQAIVERFNRITAKYLGPSFVESDRMLVDLEGKKLLAALSAFVNSQGIPHLTTRVLVEELLKAMDRLYHPGFFQPDDFEELAKRLA